MTAASSVYGYVRSSIDRPDYIKQCVEEIEQWCAREGMALGGTFTDVGAPLDAEDRIGFGGLLQALELSNAGGAVILDSSHLSPRADVVVTLVNQIRRKGASLHVKDGELPAAARPHQQEQSS